MTEKHKQEGCMFASVHRRMDDVHTLWHTALDNYFHPEKFRAPLQSCIINLRSVTFILQKQKASIPNFDSWYRPWQEKMKNSRIMTWTKDSRNTIEKERDLETYSAVIAKIIADYADSFPELDVRAGLFEPLSELFSRLDENTITNQIMKHGTLKVERRWVANTLADYEILDALAIAHGFLSLLLDDAHRHVGLPVPYLIEPNSDDIVPIKGSGPSGGRLPCMICHDERRSVYFALETGDRIEFASEDIDMNAAQKAARNRYGDELAQIKLDDDSFRSLCETHFSAARAMFLQDKELCSVALLMTGKTTSIYHMRFDQRSDKYLLMRRLAVEADRNNTDKIILIGEIWMGKAVPAKPYQYPSDADDKGEALALWATTQDGENINLYADILRKGDTVRLSDTYSKADAETLIFEPIRDMWKKRETSQTNE